MPNGITSSFPFQLQVAADRAKFRMHDLILTGKKLGASSCSWIPQNEPEFRDIALNAVPPAPGVQGGRPPLPCDCRRCRSTVQSPRVITTSSSKPSSSSSSCQHTVGGATVSNRCPMKAPRACTAAADVRLLEIC